jgi:hypothetical protein
MTHNQSTKLSTIHSQLNVFTCSDSLSGGEAIEFVRKNKVADEQLEEDQLVLLLLFTFAR